MFQDRKSLHEPRTMEELHAAAIVIATANLPGRWERVVGWTEDVKQSETRVVTRSV
jgi:hypothetical protein